MADSAAAALQAQISDLLRSRKPVDYTMGGKFYPEYGRWFYAHTPEEQRAMSGGQGGGWVEDYPGAAYASPSSDKKRLSDSEVAALIAALPEKRRVRQEAMSVAPPERVARYLRSADEIKALREKRPGLVEGQYPYRPDGSGK